MTDWEAETWARFKRESGIDRVLPDWRERQKKTAEIMSGVVARLADGEQDPEMRAYLRRTADNGAKLAAAIVA